MSVTRITHFESKADTVEQLHAFMHEVVNKVQTLPGCQYVQLLHSTESPGHFAVIEEWSSIEAHQAAGKAIPPEQLKKAQSLIAKPPTGEYYQYGHTGSR